MKYTLSKTRFRDSEVSTRPVEGELISITLHSPNFEFKSSPNTTEILEDDFFYTFVEGNKARRFLKMGILWVDYEFSTERQIGDFIK